MRVSPTVQSCSQECASLSRKAETTMRESPQERRETRQVHCRPGRASLCRQRRCLTGRQPLLTAKQQPVLGQPCSTTMILGKRRALPEPTPHCWRHRRASAERMRVQWSTAALGAGDGTGMGNWATTRLPTAICRLPYRELRAACKRFRQAPPIRVLSPALGQTYHRCQRRPRCRLVVVR
jgi:hypothetical protein